VSRATRGARQRSVVSKQCPNCRTDQPLHAFGVRKRSPSGHKSWCRVCEAAGQRQRYRQRVTSSVCVRCGKSASAGLVVCTECRVVEARSRSIRKAAGVCSCGALALAGRARCADCRARDRRRHLEQRSGLSARDYRHLLTTQHGACAICRGRCATGRRLAVDHDHATGRVRGLLCFRCNTSLARYEQYAAAFAEYLSHGGVRVSMAGTMCDDGGSVPVV
jgi:recombination endonuclease VII